MQGVHARALKAKKGSQIIGEPIMFKNDTGKLMVYASPASSPKQRLQSIKDATEKMAKQLNLNFELVKQAQGNTPIYVYYESGGEDPVPIYCDEGKTGDLSEVSSKIRNMMVCAILPSKAHGA